MSTSPLRLLVLGAHPDDAEFHAGGLICRYRAAGHFVRIVSATDGQAGHHQTWGPALAERRAAEQARAAALIGAECEIWPHADGHLEPTLELRGRVIRLLRTWQPDLVLTHRLCDYHPDHRALAQAVRDAAYLVTVPAMETSVAPLARPPVLASLPDRFVRPQPLIPDVLLDVGPQLETIVDLLACHESQVFEWLPFNQGLLDQVPTAPARRRDWLRDWYVRWLRPAADRHRAALVEHYGLAHGERIELAEAFEISEYGAPLDAAARQRLFGWLRD